jgi:hypothetical protein
MCYNELNEQLDQLAVDAQRSVVQTHPAPLVHVPYEQQYARLNHRSETVLRTPRMLHDPTCRLLDTDTLVGTMKRALIGKLEPTARSAVDMQLWACITVFNKHFNLEVGVDQELTVKGGRSSSAQLDYVVGRKSGSIYTFFYLQEGTKA